MSRDSVLLKCYSEKTQCLMNIKRISNIETSTLKHPMWSLDFFNRPNPSSRTMALGSTQPLTEMSTGN
jgi:hypothetical protein